ncbi:unnamed protein product [Tuber melanosporum]|uniref:(Perigord truffle) hypothetical protein n=1 Tax=Tuber melanosporum (strain Mel28) TaxID=656061 RepID=D5GGH8_TUBMM|nr:uncharacterized protein GSTUM_00007394001 [Tuber melanosporum]CAZ83621.1 unnamed protein product [Tuber melanosporum]
MHARNGCPGIFFSFFPLFLGFACEARNFPFGHPSLELLCFYFFRYMRGEGDLSARPMWGLTCGGIPARED